MHDLIAKAHRGLYPEKDISFDGSLKYSRAFKGYNANVKYSSRMMEFKLSYSWKEIGDEIKIGLLQHLMNKAFRTSNRTINIELYEIFLKKLPALAPKRAADPLLAESFERINLEYFQGQIMMPNLVFAGKNFNTLGSYSYIDDTIKISSALKKEPMLLDYVMYHEMLHKKLKYYEAGKKTIHHSPEFRRLEKEFKMPDVERRLNDFIRKERLFSFRWF
jgi:predicted SprT family Zn-dependent metalloprotease